MRTCRYCGVEFGAKEFKRSQAQFHNDDCKDKFHAERRRAERAKKRALSAIADLRKIGEDGAKDNSDLAIAAIQSIDAHLEMASSGIINKLNIHVI